MLKRLLSRKPPPDIKNKTLADEILEQLKESINYKTKMGFIDTWNECEKFKQGDQWPTPTPATKDLPRPVLNMVKRVLKMKASTVLQEPPTVTCIAKEGTPEDGVSQFDQEGAQLFTEAAKNTWENVRMPRINKRTVEVAENLGSAYKHWYWDQTIIGGSVERNTAYIGDIAGEVLGPDKVHLGNPANKEIQKQPYILIVGRSPLKDVQDGYAEHAKALGVDINEIKPDKDNDKLVLDASKQDPSDKYATLVHRYWKVYDGIKCFVHYAVVASGKVIRYEKPLYEGDLYPINDFVWDEVEDCAYGKGETEALIPNQKQINRMLAIYLLSLYSVGMPKISYNENFVKLSDVNANVPGGIVKDSSPQLNGWKYIQPAPMPGDIPNLLEQLTAMSKDLAGASEAFLGESAPTNASAIMMLQKQANAPVQEIRDRFFDSIEEDVRIWSLFYKRFYSEERLIKLGDEEGFVWFRGTDYYDLKLAVRVEAGGGSAYSETLMVTELKELKADQTITPDEYLEFLPKSIFPFAQQVIDRRKQDQEQMMEQQAMMPPEQGMMMPEQMESPIRAPLVQ